MVSDHPHRVLVLPSLTIASDHHLGVGVELWGATGPSNSPFSVTLDGWTNPALSPNTQISPVSNTSQLLYFDYNLSNGSHNLQVRNNPTESNIAGAPSTLDIDYMVVYANADTPPVQALPYVNKK